MYRPCLFLDIKVLRGRNVTLGTYTDWGEYVYKEVSTRRTAKSTIDSCGPWGCANFVALARPQESRDSIHLIKDGGSIVFLESQNHVMVSSLLNFATEIYSE